MPHAQRSLTIAAPVEKVFAFFTDPANEQKWRTGVKEIHADGEPKVGAVIHQTIAGPGGKGISADIQVTDLEPPRAYEFMGVSGPVRPTGSYTFAPNGDGTDVTFRLSVELRGAKALFMGKQVQKSMDGEMAALDRAKELLEG